MLFFWILWGDFCLVLLENCRPVIVPILLESHGASDVLIGLLCGSLPPLLNFIVNPIISTASDRMRSRWGRRIPFLLFGVPFVSLFLVLLGFSDQIGGWLARTVAGNEAAVAPFVITLLSVFSVGFLFFDLFAGCVYYYLFADVVPQELMGRFIGFFKMAGSCGGLLFSWVVMPYIKTHMTIVCVIIAAIYIIGFGGMCLNVKEGEYPPPSPAGPNLFAKIKLYIKECFFSSFWQLLFVGLAINHVSMICRQTFNILYGTKTIGLTTGEYGFIMGIGSILLICLAVPVGYLIDRFHAWRITLWSTMLIIFINIYGFFFCYDYVTFFITHVLVTLSYCFQNNAALPLVICLFPKEKFGQFSSANAMIKSLFMVFFGVVGGWFIDKLGYHYLFVWDIVFTGLAFVILYIVYIRWKQMGGEKGYVPPTVEKNTAKAA